MPSRLPKLIQEEIFSLVNNLLNIIDHQIGPSHVEVKYTSKGPRIIEAHTRPGGDFIAYMLEKAFKIDILSLTAKYLLGEDVIMPPIIPTGAAVRYFQINPGEIISIEGINEIRKHPNVVWVDCSLEVGNHIPEMVNSYTRSGCVVVTASSPDEAAKIADSLVKNLTVITN